MLRMGLILMHAALLALASPLAVGFNQTFTISVVPQFTPVDTGLRWTPLLTRLEAETGYGYRLRLLDKIPKFENDFLDGTPDLVFLNPYHMVMAAKSRGYTPLVRGSEPLKGILVVNKTSQINTLQDLNGKTLAFPAPNAFGASLYMRALLIEKEGLKFRTNYVGTHQNVYRHVLFGDAAAGGGVVATLTKEPMDLRQRLRVLYTTPGVPPHPIAAHPRVPRIVREKIIAAMIKIDSDPAGHKLLAAVELDKLVRADYARDYQPLEKLRLERNVDIPTSPKR